jgi:hypothetical protein
MPATAGETRIMNNGNLASVGLTGQNAVQVDRDLVIRYGGKILAEKMVPHSHIDNSEQKYQTREDTYDQEHYKMLAEDIENRGLITCPVLEYDPAQKKNVTLVGYHRIAALQQKHPDEPVPCYIASFPNSVSRRHFLYAANNHLPAKPHNMADAIKACLDENADRPFPMSDGVVDRSAVYKFLKDYFSTFHTKSKMKIYDTAFPKSAAAAARRKTRKKLTQPEFQTECERIYGKQLFDSIKHTGSRVENRAYVHTERDPALKNLSIVSLDWWKLQEQNQTNNTLSIDIVTYFTSKDIDNSRQEFLDRMRLTNLYCQLVVVESVTFAPQKLNPLRELNSIVYKWDDASGAFDL